MKATSFAAFTLMAVLPFARAYKPESYDQQFVMKPLIGSGNSLQDHYMKELFEVPENPWFTGGNGKAQNQRLG